MTLLPPEGTATYSHSLKLEETTGRLNRLVPRYVNNILDDKFKVCSYCGELYAIYDVKFVSKYEPKARLNENPFESGTQVSMINKRRAKRNKKTESSLDIYIQYSTISNLIKDVLQKSTTFSDC